MISATIDGAPKINDRLEQGVKGEGPAGPEFGHWHGP